MAKKTANIPWHAIIIALLVANLAVAIIALVKPDGATRLEMLRAGGPENFERIMEFYQSDEYKQQQTQGIEQALGQLGNNPTPTAPTPSPDTNNAGNDVAADGDIQAAVADILADAYIKWAEDARYTVLEYSDLECPFCKRHHQNGTLDALIVEYPEDVNVAFRHFPLNNIHPNAQIAGEAAECAAELDGGSDTYYTFIDEIFQLGSVNRNGLTQIARDLGISETAFANCLDEDRYADKVLGQLSEGQSLFGISGTPGNVLVDTETGRFVVIAGAFPIDRFVQELESLKASE